MGPDVADRAEVLARGFRGPLLRPGDADYAGAREIFNHRRDEDLPALIARCLDEDDVATAMAFASAADIPVAVRGGGHGVDCTAMSANALVVDLANLKNIEVYPERRVARVGAGVLLGELDAATQEHGLAAPAGTVSTTGVAGLTLGGGVGFLMRRFGATVDSLTACELVTVDGRRLRASDEENADLFWGLRGAGANLAVVTSFEFDLHPVGPELTSGLLVFPFDQAGEVLDRLAAYMDSASRDLMVIAAAAPCPPVPPVPSDFHGKPVLIFVVVHTGGLAEADADVASLVALGEPVANMVERTTFVATQAMLNVMAPPGRRVHTRGGYVGKLTEDLVHTVIDHTAAAPEPTTPGPSTTFNLWRMGGAVDDRDESEMAFSREGAVWFWEAVATWDGPENDERFSSWVDGALQRMRPLELDNGYINLSVDQGDQWVRRVYGTEAKYGRLVELKQEWDPRNLLRYNKNIDPSGSG